MNKQEVIEEIKKLEGLTILDKTINFDSKMISKEKVLNIIKQLDEQDKLVPSKEEFINKVKRYEVFQKRTGIQLGIQQEDGLMKAIFTKKELTEYGFDNLDEYEITEVKE